MRCVASPDEPPSGALETIWAENHRKWTNAWGQVTRALMDLIENQILSTIHIWRSSSTSRCPRLAQESACPLVSGDEGGYMGSFVAAPQAERNTGEIHGKRTESRLDAIPTIEVYGMRRNPSGALKDSTATYGLRRSGL